MCQCEMWYGEKFSLSIRHENVSMSDRSLVLVQRNEMSFVFDSKRFFFSFLSRLHRFRRMSTELDRWKRRDRLFFCFSNSIEFHRCESLVSKKSKSFNWNCRNETFRRFTNVEKLSISSKRFLLDRLKRNRTESKFVVDSFLFFSSDEKTNFFYSIRNVSLGDVNVDFFLVKFFLFGSTGASIQLLFSTIWSMHRSRCSNKQFDVFSRFDVSKCRAFSLWTLWDLTFSSFSNVEDRKICFYFRLIDEFLKLKIIHNF